MENMEFDFSAPCTHAVEQAIPEDELIPAWYVKRRGSVVYVKRRADEAGSREGRTVGKAINRGLVENTLKKAAALITTRMTKVQKDELRAHLRELWKITKSR